jgi:hypothetical protein
VGRKTLKRNILSVVVFSIFVLLAVGSDDTNTDTEKVYPKSTVSGSSNKETYRPLSRELEKQYPGIRDKEKRMRNAIINGDSEALGRELFDGK